jgi:hypothetical protein
LVPVRFCDAAAQMPDERANEFWFGYRSSLTVFRLNYIVVPCNRAKPKKICVCRCASPLNAATVDQIFRSLRQERTWFGTGGRRPSITLETCVG